MIGPSASVRTAATASTMPARSAAVWQVVAHRDPTASGPFFADRLQQRRFPAAAGAVGHRDHAFRLPVRPVHHPGDVVHQPSRNNADTGPWPCPNGYAALRHSVTQRLPKPTASGTS